MLKRYELTITRDGSNERGANRVDTFTWGETREAAYARTVDTMDDPMWDGWSFTLADRSTVINEG